MLSSLASKSPFGQRDRGLDEASSQAWTVVNIRQNWKQVFPAR